MGHGVRLFQERHPLVSLCLTFSDKAHVSKLLQMGRYGQEEDWFPKESPLRDCVLGTLLGFDLCTQGSCDPPAPKIAAEGDGFRETEYRNYVAGRMSTSNPLADSFLSELKRRTRWAKPSTSRRERYTLDERGLRELAKIFRLQRGKSNGILTLSGSTYSVRGQC